MPEFMGRQLWYIGMEFVQFFHKGAKNAVGPVVGLVCVPLGTVDDLFGQDHFLSKRYRFWSLTQTLPKCIINNRDCPLPELVFQAVTFHYMLACVSGKIGHKPLMDIDTADDLSAKLDAYDYPDNMILAIEMLTMGVRNLDTEGVTKYAEQLATKIQQRGE